MNKDNVIDYKNPLKNIVADSLSEFIRVSAQKMLRVAIEEEAKEFIKSYEDKLLDNGLKQVVRNGYLPERDIQTGIGNIEIKVPRVRDRGEDNISFTSSLIPKYMRRTVTLDILLPLLYLKGISTGDFKSCFEPILGTNPENLSPNVISRLKDGWFKEYESWLRQDLSKKQYVYWWVDGVYLQARMESEKNCMLVVIGADANGRKELVALNDGFRESKESWRNLLLDLKERGLNFSPKIAIGDGALGFWGALRELFPDTIHQRCWVHKTVNLLDKLPKSEQERAKKMIHDIYLAATKENALKAWQSLITNYGAKYPKFLECLEKDQQELLAFYNFPAEHWLHLRTTNPIESTFATVKHRTKKSKNCFSRKTIIASTFKLLQEAQKKWLPLRGRQRIAEVIRLEKFINGINQKELENNKTKEKKYAA